MLEIFAFEREACTNELVLFSFVMTYYMDLLKTNLQIISYVLIFLSVLLMYVYKCTPISSLAYITG